MRALPSLWESSIENVANRLTTLGVSPSWTRAIFHWVYKKFSFDPLLWEDIPSKITAPFSSWFDLSLPTIRWTGLSADGTRKFLLALEDQHTVEAVVIPSPGRLTLCLSTQVGCALRCSFCYTGTQGLKRNLTAHEIVGEFLVISRFLKTQEKPATLTHIVYMGQGEPLHNFDQVNKATRRFLDNRGLALGKRKITLSTAGLVPQIKRLGEFPEINLAVSLHSPFDEIRNELIPINKTYNLEKLMTALDEFPLRHGRRIVFEYLMIEGKTNRKEDLEALARRLNPKRSKINLIPFNPFPGSLYQRPSPDNVRLFRDQLLERGILCTIREIKGDDILAACGQLKGSRITENG